MKTIQKKVVFLISILLLAANSYAGRWLTRDPIEFMERDPKPTMTGNLSVGAVSSSVPEITAPQLAYSGSQQQANLYAFVDNNPINEIDPLGLWGVAFGNNSGSSYFNLGWGNPNLYFSPSSANDAGQGLAAAADGANPFGNPFANNGFYNPCDPTLKVSKALGTVAATALETAGGLELARFRGLEYGRWKNAAGDWEEGTHFHLDLGNGLGDHHLPQQTGNFLRNWWSLLRRGE